MTLLSICIPTYNFEKFIGQTLDSILPQAVPGVEVIILDGGSTDDTANVVQVRQLRYPQLKYRHQDFRGGIDRDIEKVVALSLGQYCWLFSADDIMLPGAIAKILGAIKSGHDIYLCEHTICDFEMKPICAYPPFNRISDARVFDLCSPGDKSEYFRSARTSEAFFSFMSSPIFKKTIWDSVIIPESFRGTCWIVAGHLLSLIPGGITVSYLGEVLLHKRGENDSFADRGTINRYRIAIESFQHVASTVFGDQSTEAIHIRRVLQQDVPFSALITAKLKAFRNPESEDINVLNRIVKMHYADAGIANRVRYLLYKMTPVVLINIARSMKKSLIG